MLRYLSIILIIHKDIQKFIEEEIYLVKFYQRTSISIFKDAGYKYRLDLIKDIEMMNENNFHQSISRFDEFESGKDFSSGSDLKNSVNKMTFSNFRFINSPKKKSKQLLKFGNADISDYEVYLIPPKSPKLKLNSLPLDSNITRAKSIGYTPPQMTEEISESESMSDESYKSESGED